MADEHDDQQTNSTKTDQQSASDAKSARPKSPAVPSFSLPESLEQTRRLNDAYGDASFTRTEMASALGLSAVSSALDARISTMRTYGLIASSGREYRIGTLFRVLTATPPNSSRFKQAAFDGVRRSEIFREILNEFSTKLPSQAVLTQRLVQQYKFTAERAKTVASVLESSLRYAGVLDHNGNILPIRHDNDAEFTSSEQNQEGSPKTEHNHKESNGNYTGARNEKDSAYNNDDLSLLKLDIKLSEGRRVVVFYPDSLTSADAEKIGKVLGAVASE